MLDPAALPDGLVPPTAEELAPGFATVLYAALAGLLPATVEPAGLAPGFAT